MSFRHQASSASISSLDVQRDTKQGGALAKNEPGEARSRVDEPSRIKLEGSDTGELDGQGEISRHIKLNRVGELSSSSLHTEEEGSERNSLETRYRMARDHRPEVARQTSTFFPEPGATETISHLIKPVGDLVDQKNLDKGKRTTGNSIDEGNTKDTHAQESNRWRNPEQSSGGSIARSRPPGEAPVELRLGCRG